MTLLKCPVCPGNADMSRDGVKQAWSCPRCGNFIANEAIGWQKVETQDHQVRLSGWIREQNRFGIVPLISPDISRRVAVMALPPMRDRANRALVEITRSMRFGAARPIGQVTGDQSVQGASYSIDADSLLILVHVLLDDNLLRRLESSTTHQLAAVSLNTKGLMFVEGLQSAAPASAQAFVAMSFSDELRDAWLNGFDPTIRAAGYRPMRIDAEDYAGGVMDRIISEIRLSRILIADCTQQRNGVYFEAGFAVGLGLTIIPTCQTDDMKNRHFDIQHLNTLEWETPPDLVSSVSKRIIAIVGPGPDLPTP
jgi:hypothetical protein